MNDFVRVEGLLLLDGRPSGWLGRLGRLCRLGRLMFGGVRLGRCIGLQVAEGGDFGHRLGCFAVCCLLMVEHHLCLLQLGSAVLVELKEDAGLWVMSIWRDTFG